VLPFLKRKNDSVAGLIIKNRTPDVSSEPEDTDDSRSPEECAQSLIDAVHTNSTAGVVDAMRGLMESLENEEPEEESSVEPHSYEAQNIKVGEND
jgi:hypothetical protein